MMKFKFLCITLLFLLLLAPNVFSYPLTAGNTISFKTGVQNPFNILAQDVDGYNPGDFVYESFCVEKNEYIYWNQTFTVDGIDAYAELGGKGGRQPHPEDSSLTADFLDDETEWIYTQWLLNTYTDGTAVQNAIWYSENEINSISGAASSIYTDAVAALSSGSGWTNPYQVAVLNISQRDSSGAIIYRQSQLIYSPVPEPATMLLLGTGLIGLAAISRRKFKQ